jgi:hypothetical protein
MADGSTTSQHQDAERPGQDDTRPVRLSASKVQAARHRELTEAIRRARAA